MEPARILIVEDQASIREYIKLELEKAGYSVLKMAGSPSEAFSLFQDNDIDLVLMDIHLGEKTDGIDVSRRMKELRNIPIIYTTAYADQKTIEKAKETSPDGYLIKPFDKHDLHTAIEIALYKNKLYQELVQTNKQLEDEIGNRRKLEKKLSESETCFKYILDGISDAIYVFDRQWNYVASNRAASQLGGVTSAQLIGKNLFDIFPGVEKTVFYQAYKRVMESRKKETVEDRYVLPDGHHGWFEVRVYPVPEGILCIASDISERKRTEQELSESEKKYRNFVKNSLDAFVLTDEAGTIIEWNQGQEKLSGIPSQEAVGRKVWDVQMEMAPPEKNTTGSIKKIKQLFEGFYQTGKGNFLDKVVEVPINSRNDGVKEIQHLNFSIPTFKGYRLGSVIRDVTQQKRTLTALKEAEERFRLLSDVTFEGIVLHKNGIVIEVNKSFSKISGYSREDIIGKSLITLLIVQEDRGLAAENLKNEYTLPYLVKARRKDGTIRSIEIEARSITYKGETISIAAIRDVTNRIESETKLKENEEKFRTFIEHANDMIYSFTPEGVFTYMSPNCKELVGYEEEDYIGKTLFDFVHPDDIPGISGLLKHAWQSKSKVNNVEYRARHRNGTYKWFVANGSPIFDDKGELTSFVGIGHDITARKHAETMLRESEERNRSIIEALPDTLFEISGEGSFLDCRTNRHQDLYVPVSSFVGKKVHEVMPEGFAKKTMEYIKKTQESQSLQVYEYSLLLNGIRQHYEARMSPKGKSSVISLVRNITERKHTEEKLASLASIIENSDNLAVIKDLNLRVIATNMAFAKAAGKSSVQGMIGKTDAEIFNVDPDSEPIKSYMEDEKKAQKLKKGEKIIREEPVIYPDGKVRIVLTTKFPVFDNQDKLIATANISTDITEHKKALEKLKTTLKYEESLAECSHELLSGEDNALTKGLKYILKTSKASRIYIFENVESQEEGLCMRQIHEVCMPGIEPQIDNPVLKLLPYKEGYQTWEKHLSNGDIINSIVRNLPQEERTILEMQDIKSILVIPIFIKNGWFGFIGFDDVEKEREWTEQDMKLLRTVSDMVAFYFQNKSNEQRLLNNNERLKSLNSSKDKIMSIIGHDLKNPIGQVLGFADLLVHNYEKYTDEKITQFHKIIYSSTHQVSSLLDNLLQWSRTERGKIRYQPKKINISSIADSVLKLVGAVALNKNISLVNILDKEIWVKADPNMMDTVLRNLVSNAIKFTEKGGTVTLGYQVHESNIEFFVKDTGVGIKPEMRSKLFDADHGLTTSGTLGERGTGLGLGLCKEFIEKHGGQISIDSEPGKGSIFYFTLPKA